MVKIYKKEIEAGLADVIQANASFSYTTAVRKTVPDSDMREFITNMASLKTAGMANPDQMDLFYLESVLVSVGWNKNDDVFDKEEVWKARHTPIDKQFNYMHDEKDIIGHLTSSIAIDFNQNIIKDDIALADIPDQYDIVVGSVLYRSWSDPQLQERMDQIIQGIQNGEWYVSMECLFPNFDYAIITPDGVQKVVARNEETSFLTKHLRMYGGEGFFNGYKVGRLLRDIVYSGKGLVNNPANPRSIITTFHTKHETSLFTAACALDRFDIQKQESINMSDITYTQAQYDALKTELDELRAKAQVDFESKIKRLEDEKASLSSQIEELTNTIESLKTETSATQEVIAAKDEKIAALETSVAEFKTKLSEAETQIANIEIEARNTARKVKLLAKVDEAKAVELVEKFNGASDELFETLLSSLSDKAESKNKMDDEEEKDKKEKSCSSDSEEESDEEKDLNNSEASDDELNLAGADENEDEVVRTKASEWFSSLMTSNKNKE